MLPIRNAWLFYPEKKGMVSGLILSCYSIGAIAWIFLSTAVANPDNLPASVHILNGKEVEKFYPPDSSVADNVPNMLRVLSYCFISMTLVATLLITKKENPEKKMKSVMYMGGDYFTDATVTPTLSPKYTPG